MAIVVLIGVLVLVVAGLAVGMWGERGGPRWARGVGAVAVAIGEAARKSAKRNRRTGGSNNSGDSI
ncbi:hypothetical protein ACQB60_42895 [Actinomycetota bacterium Odt1-20B]